MNRYALEMSARERHRDVLHASSSRTALTMTRSILRKYLSRTLLRRDDYQLEALVIEWATLLRDSDPVEWELRRVVAQSTSPVTRPMAVSTSVPPGPENHASWIVTQRAHHNFSA